MARKLLLLCCLLLAVSSLWGQDLITRTDGVVIQARVLEIKPDQITFRLFQQTDTLVYQISPQDVQAIRMADGSTPFAAVAAGKPAAPFNFETQSGRNILWYHPFDLIYSNISLAYERIGASGRLGFKIPLVIGLTDPDATPHSYSFRENNRWGTGLELNVYPFGQGRLQYYVGPAFQYRSYRAYYYDGSRPEPQSSEAGMFTVALKNGVYYQFTRFLIVSADAGIGFRFLQGPEVSNSYYFVEGRNRAYLPGNLHLGFRF
jgi:hypothetical protein